MADGEKVENTKVIRNPLLSGAGHTFPYEQFHTTSLLVPVPIQQPPVLLEDEGEVDTFVGQEVSVAEPVSFIPQAAERPASATQRYTGLFSSFFGSGTTEETPATENKSGGQSSVSSTPRSYSPFVHVPSVTSYSPALFVPEGRSEVTPNVLPPVVSSVTSAAPLPPPPNANFTALQGNLYRQPTKAVKPVSLAAPVRHFIPVNDQLEPRPATVDCLRTQVTPEETAGSTSSSNDSIIADLQARFSSTTLTGGHQSLDNPAYIPQQANLFGAINPDDNASGRNSTDLQESFGAIGHPVEHLTTEGAPVVHPSQNSFYNPVLHEESNSSYGVPFQGFGQLIPEHNKVPANQEKESSTLVENEEKTFYDQNHPENSESAQNQVDFYKQPNIQAPTIKPSSGAPPNPSLPNSPAAAHVYPPAQGINTSKPLVPTATSVPPSTNFGGLYRRGTGRRLVYAPVPGLSSGVQPPNSCNPPAPIATPPQLFNPPAPTATPPQLFNPPALAPTPAKLFGSSEPTATPPQLYNPPAPAPTPPNLFGPPQPTATPPQLFHPPAPSTFSNPYSTPLESSSQSSQFSAPTPFDPTTPDQPPNQFITSVSNPYHPPLEPQSFPPATESLACALQPTSSLPLSDALSDFSSIPSTENIGSPASSPPSAPVLPAVTPASLFDASIQSLGLEQIQKEAEEPSDINLIASQPALFGFLPSLSSGVPLAAPTGTGLSKSTKPPPPAGFKQSIFDPPAATPIEQTPNLATRVGGYESDPLTSESNVVTAADFPTPQPVFTQEELSKSNDTKTETGPSFASTLFSPSQGTEDFFSNFHQQQQTSATGLTNFFTSPTVAQPTHSRADPFQANLPSLNPAISEEPPYQQQPTPTSTAALFVSPSGYPSQYTDNPFVPPPNSTFFQPPSSDIGKPLVSPPTASLFQSSSPPSNPPIGGLLFSDQQQAFVPQPTSAIFQPSETPRSPPTFIDQPAIQPFVPASTSALFQPSQPHPAQCDFIPFNNQPLVPTPSSAPFTPANYFADQQAAGGVFDPPPPPTMSSSPPNPDTLNTVDLSTPLRPARSPSPSVVPQRLLNLGQSGLIYRPPYYHWFWNNSSSENSSWQPFSMTDSMELEEVFSSGNLTMDTTVATDGGRYDVAVVARRREAVYWTEPARDVRRCSWFRKGTTPQSKSVAYDEQTASLLEEEYKAAVTSATWQRRVNLDDGEYIMMFGPSSILHYVSSASSSWEAATDGGTSQRLAWVVKRSIEDFEIDDGESPVVDHLLFVVHGIGSVCDLKFRTIENALNDFRVISNQLVRTHYRTSIDRGEVNRVEILPVSWHQNLHNDAGVDDKMKQITLKSIPKLRHFTNDTLLDILFYTSPVYCQKIMDQVGQELNRKYELFKSRNPSFQGNVSLAGHSLGSLILFDLLCHQKQPKPNTDMSGCASSEDEKLGRLQRTGSYMTGSAGTGQPMVTYPTLDFQPNSFFAMGSPIGMFVTVRGIDSLGLDFRLPTCPGMFNIFHPFDPVAYRLEALINPELANQRPVLIPHHKGRKRMHLELRETMARVGADLKQRVVDTVRNTWQVVYQLTSFGRSDEAIRQEVDEAFASHMGVRERAESTSEEDVGGVIGAANGLNVGVANQGRRVDYVLQEAPLESFNEYVSAITSHVCYWDSEDTALFILKDIYNNMGVSADNPATIAAIAEELADPSDSPPTPPSPGSFVTPPLRMGVDPTSPISSQTPPQGPPTSGFIRK